MIDVTSLIVVQKASYARAGSSVRASWPHEQALDAASMADLLERVPYCEGPVTVHNDLSALPIWAAAAIELRPVRLFSHGRPS